MQYLLLVSNFTLGYWLCKKFSAKNAGGKNWRGFPSIRIKIGKGYVIHIHHWLYAAAALFFMIHDPQVSLAYTGLPAGFVAQGLTYRDFHRILYRTNQS